MNRHGYIVAKGMVIQHVDAEEKYNIDQPATDWYSIRLDEEGRACPIELRDVARDGNEEELHKSEQGSYRKAS